MSQKTLENFKTSKDIQKYVSTTQNYIKSLQFDYLTQELIEYFDINSEKIYKKGITNISIDYSVTDENLLSFGLNNFETQKNLSNEQKRLAEYTIDEISDEINNIMDKTIGNVDIRILKNDYNILKIDLQNYKKNIKENLSTEISEEYKANKEKNIIEKNMAQNNQKLFRKPTL